MTDPETDKLRNTPQENLELDPAARDSGANANVAELGIDAATLFRQALEQTRMAIAIVDPHAADSPIIYANRAFTELTGYPLEQVVGRNCRFLQGPGTDEAAVDRIRDAIAAEEVRVIELLNYRRDGSTFWNSLHVGPIYDDAGRLTHYYGSQWDVTDLVEKRARIRLQDEVADELHHRTKNLFTVISPIVSLSARGETEVNTVVGKVRGRLSALDEAHRISISEGREAGVGSDLYDLIKTILKPYDAEGTGRIILGGPIVEIKREAVTPVGLMLHELATNALKYGALSEKGGRIRVAWERRGDRLHLTWVEKDGPRVVAPESVGTGTRMTEGVLRTIGASLTYDCPPMGLKATLDMALDP